MTKEGEILRIAIKMSKYKISEILDIADISRGTLYNLYEEKIIDPVYKKKLEALKLNIDFSIKSTNIVNEPTPQYNTIMDMQKEIEYLKQRIEDKDEIIHGLKRENALLKGISDFEGRKTSRKQGGK